QAAEAGAQASVKQTEADYKRQVDLVQKQAVSQATLDTSTSTRDNAQANLQQAQVNTKIAQVNYGYTNVVAPFDGIVSAHQGTVDYVSPSRNPSTGTIAVRGVIPNADRALLPGFFVRIRVPFDEQKDALLVPDAALGSDQAGRYVLVVNSENIVEQRKVQTG